MYELMLFSLLAVQEVAVESGGTLFAIFGALLDAIQGQTEVFVGIITVPLFGLVKRYVGWIDALGPTVKRILVAVMAAVLVVVAQYLDAALPTELQSFQEGDVSAWIAAGTAFLVHLAGKFTGKR